MAQFNLNGISASVADLAWWDKYNQLQSWNAYTPAVISTYYKVEEIIGEGFLERLSAKTTGGFAGSMKVTIDGVVVYIGRLSNWMCGIIPAHELYYYNSAVYARDISTSAVIPLATTVCSLPYTENAIQCAIIDKPLFFKQSLKIEVSSENLGATIRYDFRRGVKI